jgi:hypothetical protein
VTRAPRIGIYVHHHGAGHAARAGAIGEALGARGADVTYLSSLPADRLGRGAAVLLPLDTDAGTEPGPTPPELHFAPLGSAGLAGRMAKIAAWIERRRPDLLLVDVSVEVALLARLCGVPYVYLRQSGERDDPAHGLAYRWAAGLLAPFPEWLERPETPAWTRERSGYSGAVTRFDGAARPAAWEGDLGATPGIGGAVGPAAWDGDLGGAPGLGGAARPGAAGGIGDSLHPGAAGRSPRVLVLGECEPLADAISAAAPDWEVLGPRSVDLDLLAGCAVVVAPAGANAVAEAAFARCGLVCVPQSRPFAEQRARGEDLERHGAAVVAWEEPPAGEWPALLEAACARRDALAAWADGEGAGRAADYLLTVAADSSRSPASSHSTSPSPASSSSQPLAGQVPQSSR